MCAAIRSAEAAGQPALEGRQSAGDPSSARRCTGMHHPVKSQDCINAQGSVRQSSSPGAGAPSPRGSAAPGRPGQPLTARAPPGGGEGGGWVGWGATDMCQAGRGRGRLLVRRTEALEMKRDALSSVTRGPALAHSTVASMARAPPTAQSASQPAPPTPSQPPLLLRSLTWKAGPVNTRCLVIWCRRCTTVPSVAQCTPMRMRGPLQGGAQTPQPVLRSKTSPRAGHTKDGSCSSGTARPDSAPAALPPAALRKAAIPPGRLAALLPAALAQAAPPPGPDAHLKTREPSVALTSRQEARRSTSRGQSSSIIWDRGGGGGGKRRVGGLQRRAVMLHKASHPAPCPGL